VRPLQPRELYQSQQYATAVYRSELAARLTALGYEIAKSIGRPSLGLFRCRTFPLPPPLFRGRHPRVFRLVAVRAQGHPCCHR
jgi:TrwC relaxase